MSKILPTPEECLDFIKAHMDATRLHIDRSGNAVRGWSFVSQPLIEQIEDWRVTLEHYAWSLQMDLRVSDVRPTGVYKIRFLSNQPAIEKCSRKNYLFRICYGLTQWEEWDERSLQDLACRLIKQDPMAWKY